MSNIYHTQKQLFSNIQSDYHKLLNTLKSNTQTTTQNEQLIIINETMDILQAQIIEFNENNCNINKTELEDIEKNNKTIEFLKSLAFFHRFMLD